MCVWPANMRPERSPRAAPPAQACTNALGALNTPGACSRLPPRAAARPPPGSSPYIWRRSPSHTHTGAATPMACSATATPGSALQLINQLRAAHGAPALAWDAAIAARAAAHVGQCSWGHSTSASRGGDGENIVSMGCMALPHGVCLRWPVARAGRHRHRRRSSGACADMM